MAEFKKISDVEIVEKLTEEDNILIIGADGALKQTTATNVGGGKTLFIFAPEFELSKQVTSYEDPIWTSYWENVDDDNYGKKFVTSMPFEEALALFRNGELTNCILYSAVDNISHDGPMSISCPLGLADFSNVCTCECLFIHGRYVDGSGQDENFHRFWTADGGVMWEPPLKEIEK